GIPRVKTGSACRQIQFQLVLSSGSGEQIGIIRVATLRRFATRPQLTPLIGSGAETIDTPLETKRVSVITAAIVIPIVVAIVQRQRDVIGFAKINSKRQRLDLARVQRDANIQGNKDARLQPVSRIEVDGR